MARGGRVPGRHRDDPILDVITDLGNDGIRRQLLPDDP